MRKRIPIRIYDNGKVFARYQGIIDPHVMLSSGATIVFTQREIDAVVMHEMGHYQRYHVELKLVALLAGIATVVLDPAWIAVVLLWWLLLGLALEIDADAYAERAGHSMRAVIERMLGFRFGWWGRLQLKLRLAMLK